MILGRFVRVMANIAGQITLVGCMGVGIHFLRLSRNLFVVAVTSQANRKHNRFARWILLMATLAFHPDFLVFFRQELILCRAY